MTPEINEKRIPEKDGVFFLIFKDGKVLLEQRTRPDKPYYQYTTIPGGKVDATDPSHEFAAKREAAEECGIRIKEMILLDNFLQMSISNHLYNVSAYLITEYEGELINVEGKSQHIWTSIEEATKLVSFVESRYVLMKAKEYLNGREQLKG